MLFVDADNHGSLAEIIDYRENEGSPASHWKAPIDTGDTFWAFDFAIQPADEVS